MNFQKFLLICIVISLAACTKPQTQTEEGTATSETLETSELSDNEMDKIQLSYGDTVMIDGADEIMIPVIAKGKNKRGKMISSGDYMSGYEWESSRGYYTSYLNLIFFNIKKDTSHLLMNSQMGKISYFTITERIDSIPQPADNFIFYEISNRDTNLDGKISEKDGSYLFASNRSGKNLVQLTPNNTQLISWDILDKSNIILAEVKVDDNRDKKFDKEDGTRLLKIDLDKLKKGRPLLDEKVEKQLKSQFYDLYLKKSE